MTLDIEKSDRSVKFGLWQVKIKAILIQNGVQKAIDGVEKMPEGVSEARWEEINTKGIWEKLEPLYMAKNVTNRLLLKSRLYNLNHWNLTLISLLNRYRFTKHWGKAWWWGLDYLFALFTTSILEAF